MWSHGITDASIGSRWGEHRLPEHVVPRCDRSSSSIDVRHVMTLNGVYQLPSVREDLSTALARRRNSRAGGSCPGSPAREPVFPSTSRHPVPRRGARMETLRDSGPTWSWECRSMPRIRRSRTGSTPRLSPRRQTEHGAISDGISPTVRDLRNRFSCSRSFVSPSGSASISAPRPSNLMNHLIQGSRFTVGSVSGNPPTLKPSASFGRITGILNTGATGTGAPRRIEFMFRAEF